MGFFNRKSKENPEKQLIDTLANLAADARSRSIHPPFTPGCGIGGVCTPDPEAHLKRIPAKCAQCGHLFDRETGQSREITAGQFRKVTIFFCSMHIPAWETAEVDRVEGSLSMGQLKNFRKSFPVDSKGRISQVLMRKNIH